MKVTKQLLEVLKNFSNINQSILFKPGEVVSTISPLRNVMASAVIDQSIEKEFAIYDLHEFLAVASMFSGCQCTFTDHQIILNNNKNTIKYTFAHKSTIVASEYKTITIAEKDIITNFTISADNLSNIIKASAILKTEDVMIEGDEGRVTIRTGNLKDSTCNSFSVEIDQINKPFQESFKKNLKVETLKMVNQDYNVIIPNKKLVQFVHQGSTLNLSYWFALYD